MTEGYQALTKAAAVIDLSNRARIRVSGEDRARLLHALTTNHIQKLLPGHGCYAFFLSAQGRILADANLLIFPEHILIDSDPATRESLYAHIDHYIIADDVTLADETASTFCLGVEGPQAESVLGRWMAPAPENDFAHAGWNDLAVARISWTGEPGYRLFGPVERKRAVEEELYLPTASAEDAEIVRIEHGIARFGKEILPTTLPAETALDHAVHANKGCYIGQEIVERVRSRGHVNKRLVMLEVEGSRPRAPGTRVFALGKDVGEITSATFSPARNKIAALGYVRVPHERQGSELEIEGDVARVL